MSVKTLTQEKLSSKRAEMVYLVTGESSTASAKAAALLEAPQTYSGLPRRTLDVQADEQDTNDGSGNQDYIVTIPYGTGGGTSTDDLEVGDTRILYSTLGGSSRITQSLSTVASYGDAEDHEGAIGVDGEGNIAGTDIFIGGLDFTIAKIVNSSDLTSAYVSDILSLTTPTPHTNNTTFTHTDSDGRVVALADGECLFMGFTNNPRGNGEDELRFDFKGSANLSDALPSTPWTVAKGGWEHVWVRYKRAEDAAANKLVTTPASAYVEQIYPEGNLGLLSL